MPHFSEGEIQAPKIQYITSRELGDVPEGTPILGVEATRKDTIARLTAGNIDPQHTGNKPELAAIEAACIQPLGELATSEIVCLVTDRPDLDSVGAMIILAQRLRAEFNGTGEPLDWFPREHRSPYRTYGIGRRVEEIAESDKASRGAWQPQPLPTKENPWPAGQRADIAALSAFVSDPSLAFPKRVSGIRNWLANGHIPEGYAERVEAERQEMIRALEAGEISVEVDGSVAVVKSTHRAAVGIGYAHAPVVVAINPSFQWQGGEPHTKITIGQFEPGWVNLPEVLADLNKVDPAAKPGENTWGGSDTIVGSPQGTSPEVSLGQVKEVVEKYLIGKERL